MTKSSEDLVSEYDQFLEVNDKKRFQEIENILDFYIAGETNNKLLLFFLLLGNYHDKLMNFILYRGDSSAGKNFVVENVLQLFPEKDVYTYDSATAKALNYDDSLNTTKILYLRELEFHQTTVEMLKSLYNAEGKVHKETIKDGKTDEHYVKEHIINRKGIVTTFSFENIQVDVVNRGWVLNPNQSHDQTGKIIDFGINLEKNLIERKLKMKEMANRCFFIAQCIKLLNFKFEVYIPYVEKLNVLLPNTQLNVRRDKNKLFNLIKIITLWNQRNRKSFQIEDDIYLMAEYTDLKTALKICQELFINLVLHLDDTKKAILDYMDQTETVALKKKGDSKGIVHWGDNDIETKEVEKKYSITEVYELMRKDTGISRSTLKRKMDDLFFEGYLHREKPKGRLSYKKLRDYDLINVLRLDEIKEEVDSIVEQSYIHYSNIGEEVEQDGEPKQADW